MSTTRDEIQHLWGCLREFQLGVHNREWDPALEIHQILRAGKGFWDQYDAHSRKVQSDEIADALTNFAGRMLEAIILLADAAPPAMDRSARTKLLVDFVVSTGLRGRVLVVENEYLIRQQAFAPLLAILGGWATDRSLGLQEYLGIHMAKDWFSSGYNPGTESAFENTERASAVFSSLLITEN